MSLLAKGAKIFKYDVASSIGIDFVGLLPKLINRDGQFDSITVVINLLTAMVHLVLLRTTYSAKEIAKLVFSEVYCHHSLPRAIVSNQDMLLITVFWTHLNKLLGMKLWMLSVYHPQFDSSTKCANEIVMQMLQQCMSLN